MERRIRNTRTETDRIESPPVYAGRVCFDGQQAQRQRDGVAIVSDVPDRLPVTAEEVGILRAFLRDEISAILRGDD